LELGSLIGFVVGGLCIIVAILISGDWAPTSLISFVDAPSIMVVFGGTIAASLIGVPLPKYLGALKAISKVFKPPNANHAEAINQIITLANLARKEGILALEESARAMDDAFLQKGVMLIVDGTDPELVRSILETELMYIDGRHTEVRGIWENMASLAPAWGMKGTFIGLVLMLQDMDDPNAIGPAMAVALITSFYGAVVANYLCGPVAAKMKIFNSEEMLMKEVLIEGMLSIQAGENPRIIEEKLKAFLSPGLRGGDGDKKEAGDE